VNQTVKAAVAVAAGDVLTGRVFNLTEGVVRAMTFNKFKWAAGVFLVAVAITGVGVGRWTMNTASAEPGDRKKVAVAAEPDPQPPAKAEPIAAGEAKPGPQEAKVDEPDPVAPKKSREFVVTRPVGTWVREIVADGASIRMALKIDEDRLTVMTEQASGNQRVTISAEADYAINKESTLYGVITSVDVDGTVGDQELLKMEQVGIGQPFAVRFRLDGDSLTLKDFRGFGAGVDMNNNDVAAQASLFLGRYTRADGKAPAKPSPRRIRGGGGFRADPAVPLHGPVPGRADSGPSYSSQRPVDRPVHGVAGSPDAIEPPSDGDVLKAISRPAGVVLDGVTIIKNRVASKMEELRFYPFVGPARLNKSQWECTVYFTETTVSEEPFPVAVKKPRAQTVHMDTQQLVLAK
jgi:hypothetical protein